MVNNNTNPDTMRKRINNLESVNYAEEIEVLNTDIENIFENTAPEYDKTQTYNEGDFVISEGVLYKAKQTTTGDFDPTKWESTTIVDNLGGGGGIKKLEWVGDGTDTKTITFPETPEAILFATGDNGTGTTVIYMPFVWGHDIPWEYYGATTGIGSPPIEATYGSNTITMTDNDYGKILNADGENYVLYYI